METREWLFIVVSASWQRSYFWLDRFIRSVSPTEYMAITSAEGRIRLGKSDDPLLSAVFKKGWTQHNFPLRILRDESSNIATFPASVPIRPRRWRFPWFSFEKDVYLRAPPIKSYQVMLPYWILPAVCAAIAAARWIKWRFSLRTLLVGTTIVAVLFALGTAFGP
jgi:hypothetical protein